MLDEFIWGRVSRISLSRQGAKLLEGARSRKTAYLAKRLSRLTPEERATLEGAAGLLERLMEDRP